MWAMFWETAEDWQRTAFAYAGDREWHLFGWRCSKVSWTS